MIPLQFLAFSSSIKDIERHFKRLSVSGATKSRSFLAAGEPAYGSAATAARTLCPAIQGRLALCSGGYRKQRRRGCLASLVETWRLNAVGPEAYLADVLEKLVNGRRGPTPSPPSPPKAKSRRKPRQTASARVPEHRLRFSNRLSRLKLSVVRRNRAGRLASAVPLKLL